MQNPTSRLHPLSFGLATGILWSIVVLLMGLLAVFGHFRGFVYALGDFYVGYQATWLGSFVGMIWAFIDAFVGGVLLAWLYNGFNARFNKSPLDEKSEHPIV